jgi:STE24 endopeptidase
VLYAVLQMVRAWWIWGSMVAVAFLLFVQILAPVFILPLFNTFVFDASRQSTRISANLSGFMGTERISLNDNLFYDHPSGRSRIEMAMRYKAENPGPN